MHPPLEGHSGPVSSVAWGPDDQTAFSAASNGVMRVWVLRNLASPLPPGFRLSQPKKRPPSNDNIPTPRSCWSATRAWARRAWPTIWHWASRTRNETPRPMALGLALDSAPRREGRRRGPGNLAVGFRRAGRLSPRPPALHGRYGRGGAGLQPPERESVRGPQPVGPRPSEVEREDPSPSCSPPGGSTEVG